MPLPHSALSFGWNRREDKESKMFRNELKSICHQVKVRIMECLNMENQYVDTRQAGPANVTWSALLSARSELRYSLSRLDCARAADPWLWITIPKKTSGPEAPHMHGTM